MKVLYVRASVATYHMNMMPRMRLNRVSYTHRRSRSYCSTRVPC